MIKWYKKRLTICHPALPRDETLLAAIKRLTYSMIQHVCPSQELLSWISAQFHLTETNPMIPIDNSDRPKKFEPRHNTQLAIALIFVSQCSPYNEGLTVLRNRWARPKRLPKRFRVYIEAICSDLPDHEFLHSLLE